MPNVTLMMRPTRAPYARVYRRRGMTPPALSSGDHPGGLVPYRFRSFHKWYAERNGFFWLPCRVCSRPFGGHEIGCSIPDPERGPGAGVMICPACSAVTNGGHA